MPLCATLPSDPGPARATIPWRPRAEPREARGRRGHGPDQGSEAGDHREAREQRGRHRLDAGAGRDADAADQRADRASARPQARPLLAARAAQARGAAPPLSELLAKARSRGLPRPHQGARPAPLAPKNTEGGSSSEPATHTAWLELPPSTKQSGGQLMSIATERRAQVSVQIGNQEISFETGHLAKQADGAVVIRGGDTMVLATAQGRAEAREGADFFPLTVDVEERMYAAGKIPGGFFKREGRPTERAILTARMIDRPIRPLWPKGFKNEVQVICTTLSADLITPHDILAINGASAALMISPLPFKGPVGAVRIGLVDGPPRTNPTPPALEEESTMDLIVVGTKEGLTMVEAGAEEVPEELLLEALELAHAEIKKLCGAQEELQREVGKPKWIDPEVDAEVAGHADRIRERIAADGLREAAGAVEEIA